MLATMLRCVVMLILVGPRVVEVDFVQQWRMDVQMDQSMFEGHVQGMLEVPEVTGFSGMHARLGSR